ncbi:hypothetical protein [Candidatus Marithrix sp. Canyon 246]|uniref:hypothetical protein n=1 Tax=Candidatus Marithrix sp. Canyon 246 TaxID=1827136 RepID=UPI000849F366|nr:hypothetical protein [Candidatus Marithrix sp. Canyon 246]
MNTLQQTAIATISKLPHTANFDHIIAALYEIRIKTENYKLTKIQPDEVKKISCLELARSHNLVGCIKNAPADLSINKGYMEGYGL